MEFATAVPAPQQAGKQCSTITHSAACHRALHVGVVGDGALVRLELVPADIALMVIA
jgi:hypothetical protein